uniref:Uncharacterized protein n=1 Tax=Arundo donax TaxID=35708 RepID=A0A0A9CNN1_ARUDO
MSAQQNQSEVPPQNPNHPADYHCPLETKSTLLSYH